MLLSRLSSFFFFFVQQFKKIQPIGYDDDIYDDPPDDWVSDQDLELFQIEKEIE